MVIFFLVAVGATDLDCFMVRLILFLDELFSTYAQSCTQSEFQ